MSVLDRHHTHRRFEGVTVPSCPGCNPRLLEHRGHGEGMNMLIGKIHGCPACDYSEEQRLAEARSFNPERWAADLLADRSNQEGSG